MLTSQICCVAPLYLRTAKTDVRPCSHFGWPGWGRNRSRYIRQSDPVALQGAVSVAEWTEPRDAGRGRADTVNCHAPRCARYGEGEGGQAPRQGVRKAHGVDGPHVDRVGPPGRQTCHDTECGIQKMRAGKIVLEVDRDVEKAWK